MAQEIEHLKQVQEKIRNKLQQQEVLKKWKKRYDNALEIIVDMEILEAGSISPVESIPEVVSSHTTNEIVDERIFVEASDPGSSTEGEIAQVI